MSLAYLAGMPKSKQATRRHFILDELLRGSTSAHQAPTSKSLESSDGALTLLDLTIRLNERLRADWPRDVEFQGVTERTVKGDIKRMRDDYNVEIICEVRYIDGNRLSGTYRYPNRYHSIFHHGLLDEEAHDVKDMLRSLRRYLSHDQFGFLTQGSSGSNPYNSIVKLFYNDHVKEEKKLMDEALWFTDSPNVLFDSAIQVYHGADFVDDLTEAIADQVLVRVVLKDNMLKAELNSFEFCPYVLKQYNNRWYCFGYSPHKNWKDYHESAPYLSLGLHDLQRVEKLSVDELSRREAADVKFKRFYPSRISDWDYDVFRHIRGVSIATEFWSESGQLVSPVTVKVAYHPNQLKYEKSMPLHESMHIREKLKNGWIEVEYTLLPNVEFYQQILKRSPNVVILAPENIAKEVATMLSKSAGLYFDKE